MEIEELAPEADGIVAPIAEPPPTIRRQVPGCDMRTLRRQVDLLQGEIEQRVRYQQLLHIQNTQLQDKVQSFRDNNESNCAKARAQLAQLHRRLEELQAWYAQYREQMEERRGEHERLVKAADEEKMMRQALDEARLGYASTSQALDLARARNAELEHEAVRMIDAERSAKESIARLGCLAKQREHEEAALKLWVRGSRGMRRAFALLAIATERQRALRRIEANRTLRAAFSLLSLCMAHWILHHRRERFSKRVLMARQRERQGEIMLRWRLHLAMEAQFRHRRAARLCGCVMSAWRAAVADASRGARSSLLLTQRCVTQLLRSMFDEWARSWKKGMQRARRCEALLRVALARRTRKVIQSWRDQATMTRAARERIDAECSKAGAVGRLRHACTAWRHHAKSVRFWRRWSLRRSVRTLAAQATRTRVRRALADFARAHWERSRAKRSLERWRASLKSNCKVPSIACLHMRRTLRVWRLRCEHARRSQMVKRRVAQHCSGRLLTTHWKIWLRASETARDSSRQSQRHLTKLALRRALRTLQKRAAARSRRTWWQSTLKWIHRSYVRLVQKKLFDAWAMFCASETALRRRVTSLRDQIAQSSRRKTMARWIVGWQREGRNRQLAAEREAASSQQQLKELLARLTHLDTRRAQLTQEHHTLASRVASTKAAQIERNEECSRLSQFVEDEAHTEAAIKETLCAREHEAAALEQESSFLSAIEEDYAHEKERMAQVLKKQQHDATILISNLQDEHAKLQNDVESAQAQADGVRRELDAVRQRDHTALDEAVAVSRSYHALVNEREQVASALESERIEMREHIRELQDKMTRVCAESAAATAADDKRSREYDAKHSLLRVRLAQVEAREREARSIVLEREERVRALKVEIALNDESAEAGGCSTSIIEMEVPPRPLAPSRHQNAAETRLQAIAAIERVQSRLLETSDFSSA